MLYFNDNNKKLFQILNNRSFTSKFIAGVAGDRTQSVEEKELFDLFLRELGNDLYVKLLFYITYEVFEKKHACILWKEIIEHKKKLCSQLHRNVEITVATLDYLSNIKSEIRNPKIIGEAFLGKIAELSSIDTLTKLYNRQHFNHILSMEFNRYKRYSTEFSLLLIDIDKFKLINDTYGHQVGDDVLVDISLILISDLRDLDVCARYGGEEFIIILPHTNSSEAYTIAERIRHRIEDHFKNNMSITISIGISTSNDFTSNTTELIKRADKALYESKANGRNRTIIM